MNIRIDADVSSYDLAYNIAREYDMTTNDYKGLIDFIAEIDEYVCDLEFTKALRDRLISIIEGEED